MPRPGKYKPFALRRSYTNIGSNSLMNRLVREYNKLAASTLEIDIISDTFLLFIYLFQKHTHIKNIKITIQKN